MTFLFPRLDWGIIISDFEKIAFFDSGAIFGIFSKVLAAKNAFGGRLKRPKMAIEPKNAIFSKCEIMIPQSNLGKRKVKLMLVRP